jgi:secondary thiamine-phosphate synthase enzyme
MVNHSEIKLRTISRTHWQDITKRVRERVSSSGIKNGICLIASLHTTAGLTINENADPDVQSDFFKKLNSVFPQDPSFAHSEGNSDSHIKASLVGLSVQLPIVNGDVQLGIWQSVYFCEFDGPRERTVSVMILGERE